MITDVTMRLRPAESCDPAALHRLAASRLGVSPRQVHDVKTVRRSIDARARQVMVGVTLRVAHGDDATVPALALPPQYKDVHSALHTVVIVGAGPAGLFAALRCLELGIRPIVVERGDSVDERRHSLADISRRGVVDPDSNYSFGEGGAGAYSDGKLYTRSKKRGDVHKVLAMFHHHGAQENILIDAHPHIGSDRLPAVIRDMRETICSHGGEVLLRTRMERLIIDDGRVCGIETSVGYRIMGDAVVLATGHSARDVYRMLHASGVEIEAKGLAIGVRLEHPQELIDRVQYHSPQGRGQWLPAAEYSFVTQVDGRGVYSFCMCPGGVVVPAATAAGQQVVNGMSASARSGRWANSGMVVEVHPGDFPQYSGAGPLEMMLLQEDLEKKFYEASAGTLNAPAQRMTDFVASRPSKSLPPSSYPPGIHAARLDLLLPEFIAHRLQQGFATFGRQRRGFLSDQGVLIGLESRTSSPVRVPRDNETLQHTHLAGLYPAGEGAGYAGGIVSAAIDGMRCIDSFIQTINTKETND